MASYDACEQITLDDLEFNDYAYEHGWTDGLPVLAPTPDRVAAMIEPGGTDPLEVIGMIGPRAGAATVERVAVNAVMAGCAPEAFPVVLAATRLLAQPEMNIDAVQATTSPATPVLIVNGEARHQARVHCGRGCLGPGFRANATIGRAVRLIMLNIGGGIPDVIDRSTQGLPSKFTLCFGENEEDSPWTSLAHQQGVTGPALTMTSIISLANVRLPDPRPNAIDNEIAILADALAMRGNKHVQSGDGTPMIVLSPGTAQIFNKSGYDKQTLAEAVFQSAKRDGTTYADQPLTTYRRDQNLVLPCASADDIAIVVAGGPEPNQALVMSSFVDSPLLTHPVGEGRLICPSGP